MIPNGNGAEYVFTQFQAPGMSDAVFEAQVAALGEEWRLLSGVIRARGVSRVMAPSRAARQRAWAWAGPVRV